MREGHVSLWHPWKDKPGQRHTLGLMDEIKDMNPNDMIKYVSEGQRYIFCNDVVDEEEVPRDVFLSERSQQFISRNGGVVAIQIKTKRKNGYLIPSSTWGYPYPHECMKEEIGGVFRKFGYEAVSPASLSEKVARGFLPEKIGISRPSHMLRKTFIESPSCSRIDVIDKEEWYEHTHEYDINKAFLSNSSELPSPYTTSMTRFIRSKEYEIVEDNGMGTYWVYVHLIAHGERNHPILINDQETGIVRKPRDGEEIHTFLWKEEIDACKYKGYTILEIEHGWVWWLMSNFLEPWAHKIWSELQNAENDAERRIIKSMAVGLPGRFLQQPYNYVLVDRKEKTREDIPLILNWKEEDGSAFSGLYVHKEFFLDSPHLTPQGAYIVMKTRLQVFYAIEEEERLGNECVRVYVDSVTFKKEATTIKVGNAIGEWKHTEYEESWRKGNSFIGFSVDKNKIIRKVPGQQDVRQVIKKMKKNRKRISRNKAQSP